MEKKIKLFVVERGDGNEIIAAESIGKAMLYYLNDYLDDSQMEDFEDGFIFMPLTDEEIKEKRQIYNEEKGLTESISYEEIAKDCSHLPCVIVTPNY